MRHFGVFSCIPLGGEDTKSYVDSCQIVASVGPSFCPYYEGTHKGCPYGGQRVWWGRVRRGAYEGTRQGVPLRGIGQIGAWGAAGLGIRQGVRRRWAPRRGRALGLEARRLRLCA